MRTILRNVELFDGGIRGRIPKATVIVTGDRISNVLSKAEAPSMGQDDIVYDLIGKILLPGIINCHTHLGWDGYGDLREQSVEAAQYPVRGGIRVARNLHASLEAGVTTIRDLGVHHTALDAKQMLRGGRIAGPRVFACGAPIAGTGGSAWYSLREADGPVEVRRAVREQKRAGAEWIKVMATGRREQEYTDAEIQAAADEAHMQGLRVTAHATFSKGTKACVLAGFDCIEHGGDYDSEVERLLVERGVWVVPTFSPLVQQARHGPEWGMRKEDVERRRKALEDRKERDGIARLRRAGVKLAFGTDAGSPVVPHNEIVAEMESLLEFGVFGRVEEILTAATLKSAEMLGQAKDLGTVEPGKLADLVVVDGDPFTRLADLRKIDKVFLNGRLVVNRGSVVRGL